ncbi:MAG: HDOD domain-containing protein [Desulfobacterota bacterium]|nr:HDOD domain-containing protein [Thermodesulfobacteriota bacterium]
MKIICPHCSRGYTIPEERIRQYGLHVIFPCPSCKGNIEIRLNQHATPQSSPSPAPSQNRHSPSEESGIDLRKSIIAAVNDLPSMPQVAQHVRRLISDKNCTFSEIARAIETDQAIAARVLKIANSAYYGVMGTVTSIQHAAMILGIKTLNQILEIACSAAVLSKRLPGYGQESGVLWRHSLSVAACARAIAKRRNPNLIDDAFSAGLIHDCGKLVLDRYLAARADAFTKLLQEGKKVFEAERIVLGFDHASLAASICEKWDIPKQLVNAIQFHHSPSLIQINELVAIVHLANQIIHIDDMQSLQDITAIDLDPRSVKLIGIDLKLIALVRSEAEEYVNKTISSL